MMTTEFNPCEVCTASIHQEIAPGAEAYVGPIHIGYYKVCGEVWIECEGKRICIPNNVMTSVIKQLNRAKKRLNHDLPNKQSTQNRP